MCYVTEIKLLDVENSRVPIYLLNGIKDISIGYKLYFFVNIFDHLEDYWCFIFIFKSQESNWHRN